MQPYYADEAVTLYHGDCRDVLPTLSGVDLVVTSPPYNLSGDGWDVGRSGKEWTRLSGGYATHSDALPHAEYVAWQQAVLSACWASLSDSGAIFYNHKPIARGNAVRLPLELIPDGLPLRQIITWDRGSGICRNLTHFVPTYEWILLLAKDSFRINTRSVDDVWRIPHDRTGAEHPAQFPLSLARRAVAATTASMVVDPFAGSGTTLRAAKDLGRQAIGVEIDERYCEIAARRLSQGVLTFGDAS